MANEIQSSFLGCKIDILEAKSRPYEGAAFNNQCRLHLGFHYPRSAFTIYQSIAGYDRFVSKYSAACNEMTSNLYAVHVNGYVSADQYLAVMDSFHLKYRHVTTPGFFNNRSEIEAVITVPEQWIDLSALKKHQINEFKGNIYCNTVVSDIDARTGAVYVDDKLFNEYDLVINATYTNPNLGVTKPFYELKYELTALVNCETSFDTDTAITIMDGPFVSIYPSSAKTHTLSSVLHTPFIKCDTHLGLSQHLKQGLDTLTKASISEKIINHAGQLIDFEVGKSDLWLSAKVKLASDYGDSRETQVKREGKLVSVLCGKLDAAFEASDNIIRELMI